MWIGDVGQDSFEEIDFRAAAVTANVNYGWHCYEGNAPFNTTGCGPVTDYVFPVYNYPTQNPLAAVTGGIVYRGAAYAGLQGYNVSADFFPVHFILLLLMVPGDGLLPPRCFHQPAWLILAKQKQGRRM